MDTNCLAVDLGTTWAKVAAYSAAAPAPQLLHTVRLPSGAGEYDGSPASCAAFAHFCDSLEQTVAACAQAYGVSRLGLTGIREGLVLLDANATVLWVSGNALLDDPRMLDCHLGDISIGGFIPAILARNPTARVLLSLQGYVAWRLTGVLAVTGSELEALGLLRAENVRSETVQRLLQPVRRVGVGVSLGPCRSHPEVSVYLAGTDEQASHHGAGLGAAADLSLATATFWSLTAPCGPAPVTRPEVRYIPAQPPYCASASVIGYRYGPYLQQALAGETPVLPDRLPRWAVGSLLDTLREAQPLPQERLVECIVTDLQAALGLLRQTGDLPARPTVAVHGGGLTVLRDFTTAVLARLGWPWLGVEGEATQLGCCRAWQD